MSKPKSIVVYIWPTKHDTHAWKYAIDDASKGPLMEPKERYTRKSDAKRGAIRKTLANGLHLVGGKHRSIEFVNGKPPRK